VNVVMRWCSRRAKCRWCPDHIEKGQPMVSVVFWNKGDETKRTWNSYFKYHPQCFVDQGLDYLKRNPYSAPKRGRRSKLSETDRRRRFLLVRKFHALEQRKHKIVASYPDRVLVENRLEKQMIDIMLDVSKLGGVPKSWSTKFG